MEVQIATSAIKKQIARPVSQIAKSNLRFIIPGLCCLLDSLRRNNKRSGRAIEAVQPRATRRKLPNSPGFIVQKEKANVVFLRRVRRRTKRRPYRIFVKRIAGPTVEKRATIYLLFASGQTWEPSDENRVYPCMQNARPRRTDYTLQPASTAARLPIAVLARRLPLFSRGRTPTVAVPSGNRPKNKRGGSKRVRARALDSKFIPA